MFVIAHNYTHADGQPLKAYVLMEDESSFNFSLVSKSATASIFSTEAEAMSAAMTLMVQRGIPPLSVERLDGKRR